MIKKIAAIMSIFILFISTITLNTINAQGDINDVTTTNEVELLNSNLENNEVSENSKEDSDQEIFGETTGTLAKFKETNNATLFSANTRALAPLPKINNQLSQYYGSIGDTFTMSIDPFIYDDSDDTLSLFGYYFVGESWQSRVIIESVDLPKAYAVDKHGKKYGVSYALYNLSPAIKEATDYIVDLDYSEPYLTLSREQVLDQSNGIPTQMNILTMRLVDNGEVLLDMSEKEIVTFYTENPINIHYRIADTGSVLDLGNAYDGTFAYMNVRSEIKTASRSEGIDARAVTKQLFFIDSKITLQDTNDSIVSDTLIEGENDIFSSTITITNPSELKNRRLELRFASNDIEIVGDEWIQSEDGKTWIYYLVDENNKYITLNPGESMDVPIQYRLKKDVTNKNAEYTIHLANDKMVENHDSVSKTIRVISDYSIRYDANQYDITIPNDANIYHFDSLVTILNPTSALKEVTFIGWNTKPDGSGIMVNSGDQIVLDSLFELQNIETNELVLYAQMSSNNTLDKDNNSQDKDIVLTGDNTNILMIGLLLLTSGISIFYFKRKV